MSLAILSVGGYCEGSRIIHTSYHVRCGVVLGSRVYI